MYAGKVGTGFDHDMLQRPGRKLARLEMPNSPFGDEQVGGHGVHWVKPKLVAQIGFTEWTGEHCATLDSSACGTTKDARGRAGRLTCAHSVQAHLSRRTGAICENGMEFRYNDCALANCRAYPLD
jgi:hypothetical protein